MVLQIETCIVPTNITPRWPLPRLQRLVSNPNIENGWFKETGTSSTWTRDDRQSRFGPVGEKFPVPHVLVFQSTNHSNVLVPTRKTCSALGFEAEVFFARSLSLCQSCGLRSCDGPHRA